jgi:hypothetical protein
MPSFVVPPIAVPLVLWCQVVRVSGPVGDPAMVAQYDEADGCWAVLRQAQHTGKACWCVPPKGDR